jgi:hypothetical protein
MAVVTMARVRAAGRIAVFLAGSPREIATIPRWLRESKQTPLVLHQPWWPYSVQRFLAEELPAAARVFEFGAGGSTLWLVYRGADVVAVEHDARWYEQIVGVIGDRADVRLVQPEAMGAIGSPVEPDHYFDSYVAEIGSFPDEHFDLVIVDGRARVACARVGAMKIKTGGFLLLDDSDRPRYRPVHKALVGWRRHQFRGLKPGDTSLCETTVWRRMA